MFNKYNFSTYLLLSFVLASVLGSNYHYYSESLVIHFGKPLFAIFIFAIGIYGIFIENEILNFSIQVQATVVAIVTEFHLLRILHDFLRWGYVYFLYLTLVGITSFLSTKYFSLTERFFRFTFIYSFSTVIIEVIGVIPYIGPYYRIISLILGLGAVFVNYLTFSRISIITSVLTFSLMIFHGLGYLLQLIFHLNYNPSYYCYYINNTISLIIFLLGCYWQFKDNSNNVGLSGNNQNYSTFNNSEGGDNSNSV